MGFFNRAKEAVKAFKDAGRIKNGENLAHSATHTDIAEQTLQRAKDMGLRPDEYFDLAKINSAKAAEILGKDPKKWEQVHEAEKAAKEAHAARTAQEGAGAAKVDKTAAAAPAAGGLGGLGGLGSKPLVATMIVGALGTAGTYAFTALTGDDPNDPSDNNLTHIQRFNYKWDKSFGEEGSKQVKLALNATRINSEADLQKSEASEADASRQKYIADSKNAPAADMSDGFMAKPDAQGSSANGALIGENIKSLLKQGYLKKWEAEEIALKWEDTTRSPVERSKEFSEENVASTQELTDFRSEMEKILENNTVGRSPEAASYVAEQVLKMR